MDKVYIESQNRIDISFRNVSVTASTKQGQKNILKNVSGICKHSEVTAILGSSGAGKTTLLNVLCNRIQNTKQVQVSGLVQANSTDVTFETFSDYGSYVMQDEVLLETMTVRECLQFAANLKVQGDQAAKNKIVNDIIRNLKLQKCQNTFIGGRFVRGVSGGERKRTSIGFELVSNPNVLVLDEPTSGLDSFTAYLLIMELKRYAQSQGKTVIFTIHSPSSDIWNILDRIILLVEGKFVYQGKSNQSILNHFSQMGFECPKLQNPADYFLSILHHNETNSKNYARFYESYDNEISCLVESQIDKREQKLIIYSQKYQSSLGYQIGQLAKRSFNTIKRNRILFRARVMIAIFMSLIVGLIYLRSEDGTDNPTSIRAMHDRSGLLFFVSLSQLMMSLNPCLVSFPSMRDVFLRESNSKLYGVIPYFFGRLIIELIPQIISPLLFGLIQFWMIGLNDKTAGNVLFYLFVLILQSFLGLSLGYFYGAVFRDVKTAVMMKPLVFVPNVLFSGFYKNRNDYAKWIGWIEYIFPLKYSFNALIVNEFENTNFTPNPVELLDVEFSKWNAVYILFGFIGGYLTLSLIALSLTKKRLQ